MYIYETADSANYDLLSAYADYNKQHPTEAERIIWDYLKSKQTGHKFRQQHIIKDYIVDFVCLYHKLVVEIDGQYHLEANQIVKDKSRTEDLQTLGYHIIRFSNEEVIANPNAVIKKIKQALMEIITPKKNQKETASTKSPLPLEGEGGGFRLYILSGTSIPRRLMPFLIILATFLAMTRRTVFFCSSGSLRIE